MLAKKLSTNINTDNNTAQKKNFKEAPTIKLATPPESVAIKVKMLGSKQLTGLEIAKDLIDPEDKEMLEDMLMVAINETINKIDEEVSAVMGSVTGGLPGMF